MRSERCTRFLPVVLLFAAAVLVYLRGAPFSRIGTAERHALYALAGGLMLGVFIRLLRTRGRKRAARGLSVAVVAGALAVAVHRMEAHDWIDVAGNMIMVGGPLGIASYALARTRDTAAFAIGAAVVVGSRFHGWSPDALLVLSALMGRDAISDGAPRKTISLAGAGALTMTLTAAIGFDLVACLADNFRPDEVLSRAHVDGPLTFIPRLAVEGAVLAACLAHARSRSWGVVALIVLTPLLAVQLGMNHHLPWMGGGCVMWGHPLYGIGESFDCFEIALGLTVVPWIGPVARALRQPPRRTFARGWATSARASSGRSTAGSLFAEDGTSCASSVAEGERHREIDEIVL